MLRCASPHKPHNPLRAGIVCKPFPPRCTDGARQRWKLVCREWPRLGTVTESGPDCHLSPRGNTNEDPEATLVNRAGARRTPGVTEPHTALLERRPPPSAACRPSKVHGWLQLGQAAASPPGEVFPERRVLG